MELRVLGRLFWAVAGPQQPPEGYTTREQTLAATRGKVLKTMPRGPCLKNTRGELRTDNASVQRRGPSPAGVGVHRGASDLSVLIRQNDVGKPDGGRGAD